MEVAAPSKVTLGSEQEVQNNFKSSNPKYAVNKPVICGPQYKLL